ncbi:MAG TPA: glycosyltransferase [Gammaproteobacteria bacterium]|nr:glycosyltransferase [Gammaproteobacteria bacterium]
MAHENLSKPQVRGKFLFAGETKLWVKGVTYGTFRPGADGTQFPEREVVQRDFAAMARNGINALRTYTTPPNWLLDAAALHGLRVMVGLPWEQHIAFLDSAATAKRIDDGIRQGVGCCAGHPAVLCYTLGNEIPPSIVRWHGRGAIERFIERLYEAGKAEDPAALFTYVNFPTTEYLRLPFLDLTCFNVYLERRETLAAYLARLQNLAGEKPLLMAEIGLDSRRNGVEAQAQSVAGQIGTAFAAGVAGAFAFAWTDEWYRGGYDIEDWNFGLTSRDRQPKPALDAVRKAFAAAPFPDDLEWPKVSVVVCSYNGSRTIRDTLAGLEALDYPSYEVIVVDDGSTDATAQIAAEYDVTLISTPNRGLAEARNTGWKRASGEIIAYIDDDAYPDVHWLRYLAYTFMTTGYGGVGGPNIAPAEDGPLADCVANAPGGPVHVLISDTEAEHIPGCNMAIRRDALESIGGFDPRYRAAGDDVDVCWRLQERGWKIGFHAAAMDWHHRRGSIKAYWRQQQGYGKAEALLEEKWPERYNALGHYAWSGRLYGKGLTAALRARAPRIYGGRWGQAPFQSLYEPAPNLWSALPLMPEWFLLLAILAILSLLGLSWHPLLAAVPLLVLGAALPVAQSILSAARADFRTAPTSLRERAKLLAVTAFLHLLQPIARLKGRLAHGLSPWRSRLDAPPALPRLWAAQELWSERWRPPESWLEEIASRARSRGAIVRQGGDFDRWDLEVSGGAFGGCRTLLGIEEHGAGRQMLRLKFWPHATWPVALAAALASALAVGAAIAHAWPAAVILPLGAAMLLYAIWRQSRAAVASVAAAFDTAGNMTAPASASEAVPNA